MRFHIDPDRPVRRHYQDWHHYCGPACVQMVVASLSPSRLLGPPAGIIGQARIKELQDRGSNPTLDSAAWATTPDALVSALNSPDIGLPLDRRGLWRVAAFKSETELLAEIALTMERHRTPAVVTTNGTADHWQVVVEVATIPHGIGVVLVDPSRLMPPGKEVRHTSVDDCQENQQLIQGDELLTEFELSRTPHLLGDFRIEPYSSREHNASGYNSMAVAVVFGTADDDQLRRREIARELRKAQVAARVRRR